MNPITFNFTGAIQNYTVAVTGTYDLSGFGAAGGARGGATGGSGAEIGGTFNLTAGQQLFIIVGGVGGVGGSATGTNNGGGGGGFSEIYTRDANNNVTPLLIAGGGGGASGSGTAGGNASVANPGTAGAGNFGGSSTFIQNTANAGAGGGGGAGATGNGTAGGSVNGAPPGQGGMSAANGAAGGGGATSGGYGGGAGGGGASGTGLGGGGGGGGSTGGQGGNGGLTGFNAATSGTGGTSYIANTGLQNFAETMSGPGTSTGSGSVTVRLVAATPVAAAPAPCYVTGTRIRVLRRRTVADVPVERLRVGDLAITASGKPRPIRWIGTRSYPGLTVPKHDRPVCIRAGALAEGLPARDLLVSPDHCLWLDGLLVAAGHLSNGTSIVRGEAVRDLTYWHVELDSHDLLMAENTPAESFLAAPGVRAGFDGTAVPDAAVAPVAYAPRAERHTPEMDALRERLILRAGLSVEPAQFGAVRAWLDVCDGTRIAGWARDDAHPDAPVCLDILVDGEIVAMALTQDERHDLAAAGMGDGRHGFDIALDEPLKRGVAHTVEVRRSVDGLRIAAMAVDAAGAWTALLAA